ncbi:MAG: hypothetical protein MJZ32_07350 [Bacteroidaceae bacterium]|nr:hypothetical protein [Bacteroidaceae bacterium]
MMTLEETKKFRYWFKYTHTDNKIVEGRKNIKIEDGENGPYTIHIYLGDELIKTAELVMSEEFLVGYPHEHGIKDAQDLACWLFEVIEYDAYCLDEDVWFKEAKVTDLDTNSVTW